MVDHAITMRWISIQQTHPVATGLQEIQKFHNTKAMSTLCRMAFYSVVKNTLAWCEQKWPKTAAIFPLESNPRSLLFTSVRFSVHDYWIEVSRIATIYFQDLSSAASPWHKNRFEIGVLCERKPYPICFWCRHKSYPILRRHIIALNPRPGGRFTQNS